MSNRRNICICHYKDAPFHAINGETVEYSGIEIAISHKGMLRGRYFNNEGFMVTQDIVNIKYCPKCGREFNK